jgi:hypothetical protein
MSMPSIAIGNIDLNQAVNNLIASIALEEAGIAHIINAEGEKIQAALTLLKAGSATLDQIVAVNNSVGGVLNGIGLIEQALSEKLKKAMSVAPVVPPTP